MSWALAQGAADAERGPPRWAALRWLLRRTGLECGVPLGELDELRADEAGYVRGHELASRLAERAAGAWDAATEPLLLARLAGVAADFNAPVPSRFEQACRAERLVLALDRLFAARPAAGRTIALSAQIDRLFRLAQSQPDFQPAEFARELAVLERLL
jgi:hypothetical protein